MAIDEQMYTIDNKYIGMKTDEFSIELYCGGFAIVEMDFHCGGGVLGNSYWGIVIG